MQTTKLWEKLIVLKIRKLKSDEGKRRSTIFKLEKGKVCENDTILFPSIILLLSILFYSCISCRIFDNVIANRVAVIKTKSATIAFFSSPPFLLLALSLSPFLFLHCYDFGASVLGLRNVPFEAFSPK